MKRRKQKGFTILELVIVIAVIGVLTGIMIPVISNIVSKANEANDVTLARNISTSLKVSSKPISSLNDIKEVVEEQYGEDSFANLTPRSASKGNHFWYNYEQGIVEVKTFDEIKEREDYRQFDGSFRSCIKEGYVFLDQQGSELASIATLLESIYSRRECDQLLEYFASQNDIASNFLANLSNTLIINENGCLRGSNYNEITNVYFTSDNVRLTKTTLFEFSENKIAFKSIDEESPLGGSGLNNKIINIKKTMFFGTDTLIFASTSLPILSVDVNNVTQLADIFSSNSTNALIRINNDNNLYHIVDKTIVNSSNNQVVYSGLTGTISDSVRNYQLPELYEATISKEVSTSNNTVTNSVNIENENVNATIPSGVKVTNNTLELTVTPKEASEANVVLGEFADQAIDVHIEGVSKDNDVPIIINLGAVLPDHLNSNNVKLYHVEDYEAIEMTRVYTLEELNSHNTYYYNYGTGEVTIAIKSFSEILLRSGTSVKWSGEVNTDWYTENPDAETFEIDTPEELAGLAAIVNGEAAGIAKDDFNGKNILLTNDIIINDWEIKGEDSDQYVGEHTAIEMSDSSRNDPAFHAQKLTNGSKYRFFKPIGYNTNHTFMGNFNGQGHTISGLFGLYYDDPMGNDYLGLFGCIEGPTSGDPITIQNLTVANSFMYYYGGLIGLVTSLSYGNVNYSNINIKDNYISQYNWHTGGIIGFLYAHSQVRLTNIVVDDSNIFEALWGTYDACIGGLIGCSSVTKDYTPEVYMTKCDVYPEMNVYNDCCANYQWFQYRYIGMVIGYLKFGNGALETADSFIRDHVHCTNVLVHYGEWAEQYYCELESAGQGSYNDPDEFKYRRIDRDQVLRDGSGKVIGCDESKTLHDHENHKYTEDNIAVNINFKQLFGGGQGFQAIDSDEYETKKTNCGVSENTHIVTVNYADSAKRFLVKDGDTITLENLQMSNHAYKWSDGTNFYEEGSVYTVNDDVTLSVALRVALNPTNGWTIDNAKFAIYALAPGGANEMWIRMALNETLNIYEAYVPITNMAKILFARVNPAAFDGTLEFKEGVVWNQTHDITDAASKHYYTYEIDNQSDGKYKGTWKNNSCVFLNPNIWNAADATERYSVYYFTNNVRSTWCDMEYDSTLDKYVCFIPNGYANLIFVRMNGNTTENNWDNDWNQTIDLGVDGNQGKTYTITGFTGWGDKNDKSSGNWDS